jgi:hypothetical protein
MYALNANTTASLNVAVGYTALLVNTTGTSNVAVGSYALDANTTASYNTAVGYDALGANTIGANNTALGLSASAAVTEGGNNVAIGFQAGSYWTTDNFNTAVGYRALYIADGTNSYNTSVGYGSFLNLTTGDNNVSLGASTGPSITTGDKNIMIGNSSNVSTANAQYQFTIGYNCACTEDNQVTIGKASNVIACEFDTDATWTRTSDERIKQDIKDDTLGLSFINDLRTVTHRWKPSSEIPKEFNDYNEENQKDTEVVMHGMLAQEVKAALDTADVDTFAGWSENDDGMQNISREMFVIPLIKAVQELSAQVEELKAQPVCKCKGE